MNASSAGDLAPALARHTKYTNANTAEKAQLLFVSRHMHSALQLSDPRLVLYAGHRHDVHCVGPAGLGVYHQGIFGATENVPCSQRKHVELAMAGAYVPESHAVQDLLLYGAVKPAGQDKQVPRLS